MPAKLKPWKAWAVVDFDGQELKPAYFHTRKEAREHLIEIRALGLEFLGLVRITITPEE